MTEIIYYVAASLDGYIATPDGGVDWLSAYNTEAEDYGYSAFYQSVNALIEGSKTYEKPLDSVNGLTQVNRVGCVHDEL